VASRFQRWTTEGQLLTVVMGFTFITCLYFWIFVDPSLRPDVLNQVLLAVLGLWGTNLGYGVKAKNDREKAEAAEKEKLAKAAAEKQAEDEFNRRLEEALKKRQNNA
jgi:hypothetical protein